MTPDRTLGPRTRACLALVAGGLLACASAATARAGELDDSRAREYGLKSAFLYNLTRFITWPEWVQPAAGEPFIVCVAASDPTARLIRETLAGKKVGDSPLALARVDTVSKLSACKLLFVAAEERRSLASFLRLTEGQGTLIVSETDAFGQPIAMVNLVVVMNRVRIEIDRETTDREGLIVSSGLLNLATLVSPSASPSESAPGLPSEPSPAVRRGLAEDGSRDAAPPASLEPR